MVFSKRLTILLTVILVLLNAIIMVEVKAQDENKVTIQRNYVVWLYSTQKESKKSIPYISLNLDKSSLNYQYIKYASHMEKSSQTPRALFKMNITLVFIGNERMYYQFAYKIPGLSINVDSNIVIDEDYMVMQWFNAKTAVANTSTQYTDMLQRPITLPPQAIEIVGEEYSLTISTGYLVLESKIGASNIAEELNIYDLSIKRDAYIAYLTHKYNLSSHNFNFTRIPMYAWIELSITSFGDYEVATVMLSGLGTNSINNALNMLLYTIPMLDLATVVLENLELETIYGTASTAYKIDIVNKTLGSIQLYANPDNRHANVINLLMARYNMVDPHIKVAVNRTSSSLRIQIVLHDRSTIGISEKDVKNLLADVVEGVSLPSLIDSINWSRIIEEARVTDMRASENMGSHGSSALALNTIIALTLVLTSLQTAVIVYVALYVYRSIIKRRSTVEKGRQVA